MSGEGGGGFFGKLFGKKKPPSPPPYQPPEIPGASSPSPPASTPAQALAASNSSPPTPLFAGMVLKTKSVDSVASVPSSAATTPSSTSQTEMDSMDMFSGLQTNSALPKSSVSPVASSSGFSFITSPVPSPPSADASAPSPPATAVGKRVPAKRAPKKKPSAPLPGKAGREETASGSGVLSSSPTIPVAASASSRAPTPPPAQAPPDTSPQSASPVGTPGPASQQSTPPCISPEPSPRPTPAASPAPTSIPTATTATTTTPPSAGGSAAAAGVGREEEQAEAEAEAESEMEAEREVERAERRVAEAEAAVERAAAEAWAGALAGLRERARTLQSLARLLHSRARLEADAAHASHLEQYARAAELADALDALQAEAEQLEESLQAYPLPASLGRPSPEALRRELQAHRLLQMELKQAREALQAGLAERLRRREEALRERLERKERLREDAARAAQHAETELREVQEEHDRAESSLRAKLRPFEEERELWLRRKEKLAKDIQMLKEQLRQKEAEEQQCGQRLERLQADIERLSSRYRQDIARLADLSQTHRAQLEELLKRREAAEREWQEAQRCLQTVREREAVRTSLLAHISAVLDTSKARTARLESPVKDSLQSLPPSPVPDVERTFASDVQRARLEVRAAKSQVSERQGRLAAAEAEREQAGPLLATLAAKLPQLEAAKKAAVQAKNWKEAARLAEEVKAAAAQHADLEARLVLLATQIPQMQKELEEARRVLDTRTTALQEVEKAAHEALLEAILSRLADLRTALSASDEPLVPRHLLQAEQQALLEHARYLRALLGLPEEDEATKEGSSASSSKPSTSGAALLPSEATAASSSSLLPAEEPQASVPINSSPGLSSLLPKEFTEGTERPCEKAHAGEDARAKAQRELNELQAQLAALKEKLDELAAAEDFLAADEVQKTIDLLTIESQNLISRLQQDS